MEDTLPENWQHLGLSSKHFEIIQGKTPRKIHYQSSDNGFKIVKFRDLDTKGQIDFTAIANGFVESSKIRGLRELERDYVLITNSAHSKEHIGKKIALVRDLPDFKKVFFVGELTAIKCDTGNIYPKFVYSWLISEVGYKTLQKYVKEKHLIKSRLVNIKIPFPFKDNEPNLEEQKRIADKIDKLFAEIDKGMEKTKEVFGSAEKILQSELNALFTKPPSGNWGLVKLGNIIKLNYGKALPKARREKGQYCVYGSNGIVGNHRQFLVGYPTIIIGRKGSAGKANLSMGPSWVIDTAFYIEQTEKKTSLKYLYYFCRHLSDSAIFPKGVKPGINRNQYLDNLVPLPFKHGQPDLREQRKIVKKLDGIQEESQKLQTGCETQLKYFEMLKQSILNQAFQGKL